LDFDNNSDIKKLITIHNNNKNDTYKKSVHTGTDVKKLQYKINYDDTNKKYINIHEIIQNKFFPNSQTNINTLLINLEKDLFRYNTALNEFKKLLITDFIHLKATHWKEKNNFVDDMNNLFEFLKNYNSKISSTKLLMDIFSVFNDKNIYIQDGPLACYCSHVRAMVYGFLNFKNYTLIVEDDFHINDIELVEKNINLIPDDWDIICFGAQPINKFYEGSFYKFTDLFHSTQFYIIKNSSFSVVFENVYPIYDQIDILLSKLHDRLNIYNIPNSIMQKNFESNTQNNLYVIYNSPNYQFIRICIDEIKILLHDIIMTELKIDNKYHDILKIPLNNIVLKILFDVVFSKILYVCDETDKKDENLNQIKDKHNIHSNLINNTDEYENSNLYQSYFINNQREKLYSKVYIIINSCIKGINVDLFVKKIIDDIYEIICNFDLTKNNNTNNNVLLPLNYGSTSNVYLSILNSNGSNQLINQNDECVVIKEYVQNLRWVYENHSDQLKIIEKEIKILEKLNGNNLFQKMIKYQNNKIYLEYVGETLFDNFKLPKNWKEQLTNIFGVLDDNKIIYSEFNLKNITNKNDKLFLIDFGLCLLEDEDKDKDENKDTLKLNNSINLENFIELLGMLENKFKEINDLEQQHIYYFNFINNIKLDKNSKYSNNIY
jgi:tRNA A-37 threonylcarbamoyl transferase component Bud32